MNSFSSFKLSLVQFKPLDKIIKSNKNVDYNQHTHNNTQHNQHFHYLTFFITLLGIFSVIWYGNMEECKVSMEESVRYLFSFLHEGQFHKFLDLLPKKYVHFLTGTIVQKPRSGQIYPRFFVDFVFRISRLFVLEKWAFISLWNFIKFLWKSRDYLLFENRKKNFKIKISLKTIISYKTKATYKVLEEWKLNKVIKKGTLLKNGSLFERKNLEKSTSQFEGF